MILSDRERKEAERLLHNAWGPEIDALTKIPDVEDIAINQDGRAFVYGGIGKRRLETRFERERIAQIVTLSSRFAGVVADDQLRLSFMANLPGHIRFQGGLPPRSVDNAYAVLRMLPKHVYSFDDWINSGIAPRGNGRGFDPHIEHDAMDDLVGVRHPTMDCLAECLRHRLVIAIFGETGSGKTSLLTTLCNHDCLKNDRIITLEDTPELQFPNVEDVLRLSSERGTTDAILKDSLRCRPDRIVMGEARDGAFWSFIKAMYTGHKGGLITLHANSPSDFFDRCEHLIAEAGVDAPSQRRVLMKTLQRIVWIRRKPGQGREIVGVFRAYKHTLEEGYVLQRIDVPHPL